MIKKFKTVTPTDKKWTDPINGVTYSVFEVELECGHKYELSSTGWISDSTRARCDKCLFNKE
jgi:hypothetical protein